MTGLLVFVFLVMPDLLPSAFAQGGPFGTGTQILPRNIEQAGGNSGGIIALIKTVIDYFLGFIGIILIALVIYGGFMYVTAGVNEQGAETGKKTLMYAAIGIVIILLSFVFVNALLGAASGTAPT